MIQKIDSIRKVESNIAIIWLGLTSNLQRRFQLWSFSPQTALNLQPHLMNTDYATRKCSQNLSACKKTLQSL